MSDKNIPLWYDTTTLQWQACDEHLTPCRVNVPLLRTNKKLSKCWDCATCEPLDAYCRSAKLHIFLYSTGLPRLNSGSQDTTIQVDFGTLVAKTPIYPVMCPVPLFVALCDYSPSRCYRRVMLCYSSCVEGCERWSNTPMCWCFLCYNMLSAMLPGRQVVGRKWRHRVVERRRDRGPEVDRVTWPWSKSRSEWTPTKNSGIGWRYWRCKLDHRKWRHTARLHVKLCCGRVRVSK